MEEIKSLVIKASGEKELFDKEKVIMSIKRAGIPSNLQNEVLSHIVRNLHNNMTTQEIYNHIIEYLEKSPQPFAKSKYSLKHSLMALGPTGYPFEDFIAEILKSKGYETKVRQILTGKCVTHEIDVVATKNDTKIIIECKFHNMPGIRSDIHVALYTKARFEDVKDENNIDEVWLITNTKATEDAIKYGLCSGVKIIAWDYPLQDSLRDWIETANLHPLTELITLNQNQKQVLFEQHIILCKSILDNPIYLDTLFLKDNQKQKVLDEIKFICQN